MDIYIYLGVFLCLIVFFAYQSSISKKKIKAEIEKKLNDSWGTKCNREYKIGELDKIRKYFDINTPKSYVDDITWNDMGMDDIFKSLNHTLSSIGEDCLYARLRSMEYTDGELAGFNELVNRLNDNPQAAIKLQQAFYELGRTKSVCIYEFIKKLASLPSKKNTEHIVRSILFIGSIAMLFVQPIIGIICLIVMLSSNVIRYYRLKKDIEDYFVCFSYLVNMVVSSRNIIEYSKDIAKEQSDELAVIYKNVVGMTKGVFLIAGNNMSGSLGEIVMEYVRMIFHVDIMKFNSMLKAIQKHQRDFERLYQLIGELESACAVASYRVYLEKEYKHYCTPTFDEALIGVKGCQIYHPLINNPVKNTIDNHKSVLLTGSNASGKSTFLKTVGICAILGQTIYTCPGQAFSMRRCNVYSSMSLKDDLLGGESYYIVEIKALKRIIDAANRGERLICFVDEVLRGTNTVERVSASTEILEHLASFFGGNVICFAATHDIELTHLLEETYENYHFEEQVVNDDVLFNYQLNSGRATSRNAIQLLKVMGYDDSIIEKARARADRLLNY